MHVTSNIPRAWSNPYTSVEKAYVWKILTYKKSVVTLGGAVVHEFHRGKGSRDEYGFPNLLSNCGMKVLKDNEVHFFPSGAKIMQISPRFGERMAYNNMRKKKNNNNLKLTKRGE